MSFYTKQLTNPNPGNLANEMFTPLNYAAQEGHLPVVQHICSLLEDKNPKNSHDHTPLHTAASNGHLEIVKYLVNHVEDIHPKDGVYCGQKTPLDYAKEHGHSEVVKYFQHSKRKKAKGNKNVKNSMVTQGSAEEYNIDSVLQSLGIKDETKKVTSKNKPKKKTKKLQIPQEPQIPQIPEAPQELQDPQGGACRGAEAVVDLPVEVVEEIVEPDKEDECTICFEPRNPSYLFFPCGHATFCKDCALHLSETTEKRCPDCRSRILGTCRVFQ